MKFEKAKRKKILVVEDSATQRELLKVMFDELEMDVETAADLASGLALLKSNQYDAVMLDLILPDSAGIETLIAVSAAQAWTPIVVLTSLEEESLGDEALRAGAEDYLVKGEVSQQSLSRSLRYAIERKKQSSRIYESEKRLRTTIDNSYDAFIAVDENLNIVEWNTKAEEMFGYTFREARGKDLTAMCFPHADGAAVLVELRKCFEHKQSDLLNCRREIVGLHRGGREFPAEIALFPVEQGLNTTICTFVSDITDRKEFERHASEFYSTVAHELRAPLTSIKASLRLMEGGLVGNLPEKAKGMVTIGRDSCDRLIRLIGDLLDLSKFEAGKMPLTLKEVQAKSLVARAASECEGTAANAKVKLLEECDEDCLILADGDRILQVLVNLLSNALKFSPEGSTVTIRAKQFGEHRMRFSVKDQGPGIAKNDLEKLFQKFQQLQNSANAEGTGLGLAICKAIAGQHMGDMGVSSVLGEGSEFWLELPINCQNEKVSSNSKDLQAANS